MSSDDCDDCAEHAYLCDVAEQKVREQAERIKALEAVAALLYRYRHETPLGHQPHMIAHEVDKALQAAGYGVSDD